MAIITLAGPKDGIGKTTLSIHLTTEWVTRGYRVVLLDADRELRAMGWANTALRAGHPAPRVMPIESDLRRQVKRLSVDHDLVVLDTAGGRYRELMSALLVSDLALLPCQPTRRDLFGLEGAAEALRQVQGLRAGLMAALVLNGRGGSALDDEARGALRHLGVPALSASLGQRDLFAAALEAGRGVTDFAPRSVAAMELRNLADSIEALLWQKRAARVA